MLLGDDTRLHVRVDIDENDAWRFQPCASAMASVRGNPEIKTPLQYVRTDLDVIPKMTLTGDTTQRTDTRVLQVIYSFDPASLPLYVGQLMDVFIEAAPTGGAAPGPQHPSPARAAMRQAGIASPSPLKGGNHKMLRVAMKMLLGDRAKYVGLLFGITFTSFLVTFAGSYFCGFMTRGFALIAENPSADVWVMDPAVESTELITNIPDGALARVRSVEA